MNSFIWGIDFKIFSADEPGRMNTEFSNFTLNTNYKKWQFVEEEEEEEEFWGIDTAQEKTTLQTHNFTL